MVEEDLEFADEMLQHVAPQALPEQEYEKRRIRNVKY